MKKNKLLLIALSLLTLGVTSCKEDYFDQGAYQNIVQKTFPVQNVDPQHNWATMGTAIAEIEVNGDYGKTYNVRIYQQNPLNGGTVTTLLKGSVQSGRRMVGTFTYPLAQSNYYIGVFDEKGRRVVQSATIADGKLRATFGSNQTSARHKAQEDASRYPDYVKTVADYLNPVVEQWGYRIPCNQISVEEMANYGTLTDADIERQPTPTNALSQTWDANLGQNVYTYEIADGKHFLVAAGTEITKTFHLNATQGIYNDVVLYVLGKVHLNGNTLNGPTLVVGSGGEIVIDGEVNMSNAGRFVVLPGGRITSSAGGIFKINNGGPCYNGGTINITGELNANGCDLYNAGSMTLAQYRNTSSGKLTNFGTFIANTNQKAADAYNSEVINGCYMRYTGSAGIGTLTMLDNSRLDVGGRAEFNQAEQYLYANSLINAGSVYVNATSFFGPANENDFAIIKTDKIIFAGNIYLNQDKNQTYQNERWTTVARKVEGRGTIYLDWEDSQTYDSNGNQITDDNGYTMLSVVRGSEYSYVHEASALPSITIPAGECTGTGYNTTDGGDDGDDNDEDEIIPEPNEHPFSLRYCFEDNFPTVGDYDFNDVVITLTPEVEGRHVKLTVALDAVGATEQVGAAIRIAGLSNADIVGHSRVGNFDANFPTNAATAIVNTSDPQNTQYLLPDNKKNNTTDVVLNLFSHAHWAMKAEYQSNGSVKNWFYNTVKRGDAYSQYENDVTVRTVVYEFELASDEAAARFTEDYLDVFIVEGYNGGYWEVHTVPWKTTEVLRDYASGNKMAYNDNFPWAICVPGNDFKYPVEWQTIGTMSGNVISGAYQTSGHSFAEWAQNHTRATDWYMYPTAGLVYE